MMVGEVAAILKGRGAKVAVVESCTGGRLSAAFTASAGASEYFLGGVVAYDNDLKITVLGVGRQTLEKHGAVSREVAVEMARGARRITGADFAIATTGIAGPGGGTPEKPVGTVWIAVATPEGEVHAQKMQFHGSRPEIMDRAVVSAVEMLRAAITAKPRAGSTLPERHGRE
jgi:nicotinamide-nucleotide amidase